MEWTLAGKPAEEQGFQPILVFPPFR